MTISPSSSHVHRERIEPVEEGKVRDGLVWVKGRCQGCGSVKEYRAGDPYLTPKKALEKVLRA